MLAYRWARALAGVALAVTLAACAQSPANFPDGIGNAAPPATKTPELPPQQSPKQTFLWEFAGIPRKGRVVFVNIPSYELIAFEDGRTGAAQSRDRGFAQEPDPRDADRNLGGALPPDLDARRQP